MIRLTYESAPSWPPLAWIARLPAADNARGAGGPQEVIVTHGPLVETRPDWFGEIVWAGDLSRADFDRTDLAFGSGARLRGIAGGASELVFVPSGTTVDRLQWMELDGELWISNSLACLLATVNADLDPADDGWFERLGSIKNGIEGYHRELPTSAGPVHLAYFNNLVWDGGALREVPKPHSTGGFASFEQYRDYLADSIGAVAANAADPRRRCPMPILGTLSGGYDSPMMSVLAQRAAGLREAFNFQRPDGSDTGQEIARILGIELHALPREGWRSSEEMPEIQFIAADAKGEDVFMHTAAGLVHGRTVLTGHFAGVMLDRNNQSPGTVLSRRDRSGTSVMEWRLHAGCIHVPVAYMGARHAPDITRITQSEKMRPWSLGGWYDRPIARRILEEAGVPREAFGTSKRAGSILFFKAGSGMTPTAERDFQAWLREHSRLFLRRGKLPPALGRATASAGNWLHRAAGTSLLAMKHLFPAGRGGKLERLGKRLVDRGSRDPLFDYVFPWAVDRMKRKYARIASARGNACEQRCHAA
jgi:hypothetical protein